MMRLIPKKMRYALAAAGLLAVAVITLGAGIYRLGWQSSAVQYASRIIPYPAILVGGSAIPLDTYLSDLAALNRFWEFQSKKNNRHPGGVLADRIPESDQPLAGISPNDDEIRERLVAKLVEEKITQAWAAQNNITVTDAEAYAEWENLYTAEGSSQEISAFVQTAYGWTDEQFIERVLKPFLLRQKVTTALAEQTGTDDASIGQESARVYQLAAAPDADFGELAKQHSQDSFTADKGGDLGYFGRGAMEPVLEHVIFGMEPGEISEPVKSSFGWHVIKLEDLLYTDEGVPATARARHILIAGFNLDEWLQTQKRELAIYRLVR